MVRGRRGTRRRGRWRHAADDHRRRRHGLVVGRLRGTAVAGRRPVGRRGLARRLRDRHRRRHRLRVPAFVARAVLLLLLLLPERAAVVPGPAAPSVAVRMADARTRTDDGWSDPSSRAQRRTLETKSVLETYRFITTR